MLPSVVVPEDLVEKVHELDLLLGLKLKKPPRPETAASTTAPVSNPPHPTLRIREVSSLVLARALSSVSVSRTLAHV